ncbi:hypothetical protein [Longimicrobium sp.]|uniref:hypothetical protein n=1 Tax=Longimicrobium sp. TaxID=2029185 RepID=UPI003B3B9F0E
MRITRHPLRSPALCALALLLVAGCSKAPSATSAYVPVECGQGNGQSRAAEIGEGGGSVAVGPHTLIVPPQALSGRTTFTITERAAGHIGVEVEPHGTPFAKNATLILSFARCGGPPAGFQDLRVVEVQRNGRTEIIRVMPSTVNVQERTVTTTGLRHLSGYLIGGNRTEE